MRILVLDQYSEMGGAQACLLDLVPAILGRGWTAHAALPGRGPLTEKLRSMGVTVHDIPCGPYRSGRKTVSDLLKFTFDVARQIVAIRRLLEEMQFDLVYVNGARLLPAAAIAVQGRMPMVFHAHWRYAGAAAMMARLSIRRSRASVIACCRHVARPLDVPERRLHMIFNGVSDCGFRTRHFDAPAAFRIGIIGRIAPEKGQTEFLQAASLLAPEFPDARFLISGAPLFADQVYDAEVRIRARGLPVEFLGWRNDVDGVLRELDLLVIASVDEGLPRVMLEAFSAGVPVVAFPAGGIPEVLEDEQTGFLVPEFSAPALADRIRSLMTGEATRLRNAAQNARRAWEQSYNLERYQNRITNLLADLATVRPAEIQTTAPPPCIPSPPPVVLERTPAER